MEERIQLLNPTILPRDTSDKLDSRQVDREGWSNYHPEPKSLTLQDSDPLEWRRDQRKEQCVCSLTASESCSGRAPSSCLILSNSSCLLSLGCYTNTDSLSPSRCLSSFSRSPAHLMQPAAPWSCTFLSHAWAGSLGQDSGSLKPRN